MPIHNGRRSVGTVCYRAENLDEVQRTGAAGGAGMSVYELIQELAYFKADTPVFVKIRNTSTEFEVDSVDFEFR